MEDKQINERTEQIEKRLDGKNLYHYESRYFIEDIRTWLNYIVKNTNYYSSKLYELLYDEVNSEGQYLDDNHEQLQEQISYILEDDYKFEKRIFLIGFPNWEKYFKSQNIDYRTVSKEAMLKKCYIIAEIENWISLVITDKRYKELKNIGFMTLDEWIKFSKPDEETEGLDYM